MPAIGELRDRYTFQRPQPGAIVDGLDKPGGWGGDLPLWAATKYLHGGEGIEAARAQGVQTVILTVRAWSGSRAIDNSWRALDERFPGRAYNVTDAEELPTRDFIQIRATTKTGQSNAG